VNDATIHWPGDRSVVRFGTVELTAKAPEDEAHRRIIFDPIPRVQGIERSDDPLLELRAAVYLLSGRRRRQATEAKARTRDQRFLCGRKDRLRPGEHHSKMPRKWSVRTQYRSSVLGPEQFCKGPDRALNRLEV
jgi:hypothetical protein